MAGNPAYIPNQNVDKSTVRDVTVFVIATVAEVRSRKLDLEKVIFIKELSAFFDRIPSDTTTQDDGVTFIRDANANGWRRTSPSTGAIFIHAAGTFSGRSAYNSEPSPRDGGELFIYLSTDGDGSSITDPLLYAKLSDGNSWSGGIPIRGPRGGDRYEIKNWDNDRPATGEELSADLITTDVVFPVNFLGSRAKAKVAALAEAVYSIQKNGIEVGTLTFGAGEVDGVFSMASELTCADGDMIDVIAPDPRDEELAGVVWSLVGTRIYP